MIKRASAALLTTMAICALATSADCQSFGTWNPALTYHTVDASALGTDGRGFIEYSTSDDLGRTLAGGVGLWGGMFRATYAKSYSQTNAGLGYGRMLAVANGGKAGTLGVGVDLFGAMDFRQRAGMASRAARVSIPLSLRWGSPSRLSIAPYVAPYGEIGRATRYQSTACGEGMFCNWEPTSLFQTHALGVATGVQLTAWRLSMELGLRDLPRRQFGNTEYKLGAGLRWRF